MKCKRGYKKVKNKCVINKSSPIYNKKPKATQRLLNSIIIFFIFAFIGAVLELFYGNVANGIGIFYSKGLFILLGIKIPLLPVYGFGGLFLISILNILDNTKVKFIIKGLIASISIIIFELISAGFTYIIFGQYLWDYSSHSMNINGAISLQVSVLWIISVYIVSAIYLKLRENKTFKRFTQII